MKKHKKFQKLVADQNEGLRKIETQLRDERDRISAPLRAFANREATHFITIFCKEEFSDDSEGTWFMQGVLPTVDAPGHSLHFRLFEIWMHNDFEEGEEDGPIKIRLGQSRDEKLADKPSIEVVIAADYEIAFVCTTGLASFEYRVRRFPSKEAALAHVEACGGLLDEST